MFNHPQTIPVTVSRSKGQVIPCLIYSDRFHCLYRLCGGPWALGTLTTTLNGEQNLMMLKFNSAEASDRNSSAGFSLRVRARNVGKSINSIDI